MAINNTIFRRAKKLGESLRNFPLLALCALVSVSVEVFAWGSILQENTGTVSILGFTVRLAYAEIAMSSGFSLAALMLAAASAQMRSDPRPAQRRRAFAPQALALIVLCVPVYYASECSAVQSMLRERASYVGSDQHQADLRDSRDMTIDSMSRRDAADRLGRANPVTHADLMHLIPALLWIGGILGVNMLAVRFGWRARPETPAEAKARIAQQRAAKAKYTREANKRNSNVTELHRRA